ncbi:hypothetical protein AZE42_07025 [Rhizopogon vesiculosus]|uniref:F-box domain-containing protein n=1 Tax=Rhizopogon vesiculosus TaxID=180088 RepID=A0A1J8R2M1_9AGAM|nr:hypothetical protein AZE42_07025 [Rhizopogon vesiculosus]
MIPNSVSALKARRRAKTPGLPSELWLVIFDLATYVPGIFIPEIFEYSVTLGRIFNRYHHPLIRRALVTKRSLVRVCKQWWHLATPFLYRSIIIGRGRCLASLASALALSTGGKGVLPGERPLGSYTERLDIAMRDHRYAHMGGDLELLAEVIRLLQNLAIVSVDVSQCFSLSMPDTVMDALTCVAPSLKIVYWAAPRLLPPSRSLQNIVTASQLHILHCPHHFLGRTYPMDLTLSSCTTLAASDHTFHHMSLTQFPALRELIYRDRLRERSPASRFLEMHGKNLTSVHLLWSVLGLRDQINILAAYSPNLRRLTITFELWGLLDTNMFDLVPIEYFGLSCRQSQSPTNVYKVVLATLAHLKEIKSTLHIIRFTNYLNVNELLKNHRKALLPALELLSGKNFRLEDHEGRLLSGIV